jgi:hypothetical protein
MFKRTSVIDELDHKIIYKSRTIRKCRKYEFGKFLYCFSKPNVCHLPAISAVSIPNSAQSVQPESYRWLLGNLFLHLKLLRQLIPLEEHGGVAGPGGNGLLDGWRAAQDPAGPLRLPAGENLKSLKFWKALRNL